MTLSAYWYGLLHHRCITDACGSNCIAAVWTPSSCATVIHVTVGFRQHSDMACCLTGDASGHRFCQCSSPAVLSLQTPTAASQGQSVLSPAPHHDMILFCHATLLCVGMCVCVCAEPCHHCGMAADVITNDHNHTCVIPHISSCVCTEPQHCGRLLASLQMLVAPISVLPSAPHHDVIPSAL